MERYFHPMSKIKKLNTDWNIIICCCTIGSWRRSKQTSGDRVVKRWALSHDDPGSILNPGSIEKIGQFFLFTPHWSSSLSCINEYLALDSDGLCERIVYRRITAARLNASQRSWTCVCMNRPARGVIVSGLNSSMDWMDITE